MRCELLDALGRHLVDKRYAHDCFAGIPNPLDVGGHEVDIFVLMAKALFLVPVPSAATEFHADDEAIEMMRRQFLRPPEVADLDGLLRLLTESGIVISLEELKDRQVGPRLNRFARPAFSEGPPMTFRRIRILRCSDALPQ